MSFKTKKYEIIRNAISKELATFSFNYLLLKSRAVDHMLSTKHILTKDCAKNNYGHFSDRQAIGSYSVYGDPLIETLLMKLLVPIQVITRSKLVPCYGYSRLYEKGAILKRHTDRPSCETSATLHLGGDPWKIYLQISKKDIGIHLTPGDMLVYDGVTIEHERKRFTGEAHGQAFLHYNNIKGKYGKKNKFDGRAWLGLPYCFKHGLTK